MNNNRRITLNTNILRAVVKRLEGPGKRLQFFAVFSAADLHILLFVDSPGIETIIIIAKEAFC